MITPVSIIVHGPTVLTHSSGRATYRVRIDGIANISQLWFSVPASAEAMIQGRLDAAVVALLMPAMRFRTDLHLDGPVTDELVRGAGESAQEVLRRLRPELARVEIISPDARPPSPQPPHVATGYSAGIDSFTTLAKRYFDATVPDHLRISHLLYNNVGSHGHGERGNALFRQRLARARSGAAELGLPLIDVESNVDEVYLAADIEFQPSHTMRNMAVAHLLGAGVGRYYYSSSAPYDDVKVAPTADIGIADPLLLQALSTRSLTLTPVGTDLSRSAKVALVSQLELSYRHLDVCLDSSDGSNCSKCSKCRRTMLMLDLLGALDRYQKVFHPPTDPHWREDHIVQALVQELPSARSVVRLYDEHVGISPSLRMRAHTLKARRFAHRALMAGYRRIRRQLT